MYLLSIQKSLSEYLDHVFRFLLFIDDMIIACGFLFIFEMFYVFLDQQ